MRISRRNWLRLFIPTIKRLLENPIRLVPVILSVITIFMVFLFTSYEIVWSSIRVPVTVTSSYLQIAPQPGQDGLGYMQGYIYGCDHIVAIDGVNIKQLESRVDTEQTIFLPNLDDDFDMAASSLTKGATYELWSTRANHITLDVSACPANNSNYIARFQLTQCATCFSPVAPGASIEGQSESLVNLNLNEIKIFTNDYISILLLTLITLSFCATGLFFYLIKPG